MKQFIKSALIDRGAVAVGFVAAGKIDDATHRDYTGWIEDGHHGEMNYLERHVALRAHTDSVLPGAKTVISLAFGYKPETFRSPDLPYVSSYAFGEDYHTGIRKIILPLLSEFKTKFGGKWRLCIDSAPVAERYWAVKSGIGKRGLNGNVIVEGCGPFCFLAEILTTIEIPEDTGNAAFTPGEEIHSINSLDTADESSNECEKCRQCLSACPTGALRGDGTMDARLCLNYLTIEKKSDLTSSEIEMIRKGGGTLFGCDRCLRACPHSRNNEAPNIFPQLGHIAGLEPQIIVKMDEETFNRTFFSSPLLYAGFKRVHRIASLLLPE